MQFPEPKDKAYLNNTHYFCSISNRDTSKLLLEQFKSKFAYLIYTAPDVSSYNLQKSKWNLFLNNVITDAPSLIWHVIPPEDLVRLRKNEAK